MGAELKGKVSDPTGVLKSWSRRTLNVLETEVDRLKALDRAEPSRSQPPNPDAGSAGGAASAGPAKTKKKTGGGLGALGSGSGRNSAVVQEEVGFGDAPGGLGSLGGARRPERGRGRNNTRKREPAPGENQPAEVVASRRLLNHALQQLQIGATGSPVRGMPDRTSGGLLSMVEPDATADIETWVDEMATRVNEINDEYLTTREDYIEMLEAQVEQLREMLPEEPAANPAAPPAEAKPEAAPADELAGF